MSTLNVLNSPCSSCPYRKDIPTGVWHASEYEKLRLYDDTAQNQAFIPFHCHQEPEIGKPTLCRGWLSVHCESAAVRILGMQGNVTEEQVYAEVKEPLYKSGNEAADAGLKGIKRPSKKARKIVERLIKKGGRKFDA